MPQQNAAHGLSMIGLQAIIGTILLGIALLFAFIPWIVQKCTCGLQTATRIATFFSLSNCLAAGVVLGAALSHMLPSSINSFNQYFASIGNTTDYPYASLCAGTALCLLIVIENLILTGGEEGHQHGHSHGNIVIEPIPAIVHEEHREPNALKGNVESFLSDRSDVEDSDVLDHGHSHHHSGSNHSTLGYNRSTSSPVPGSLGLDCSHGAPTASILRASKRSEKTLLSSTSSDRIANSPVNGHIHINQPINNDSHDHHGERESHHHHNHDSHHHHNNSHHHHHGVEIEDQFVNIDERFGSLSSHGTHGLQASGQGSPKVKRKVFLQSIVFVVALSIHSVLEGMGLGSQRTVTSITTILAAILVHKGLAALALGIGVHRAQIANWKSVVLISIFALATPLGMIGGVLSNDLESSSKAALAAGIMTGAASGTFLYISLIEILPQELCKHTSGLIMCLKLAIFTLGWGLFALLAKWA